MKLVLKLILILLLLGGGTWFLFFSKYSKIENVNVVVSQNKVGITAEDVYSKIKYLEGKNIFLISKNKIKSQIKNNFSAVKSISIVRNFRKREINIEVSIYQVAAVWCADEQKECFYLNPQGIIFQKSPIWGGNLFLVINNLLKEKVVIGQEVIKPKFLNFISQLNQLLTNNNFLIDKIQVRSLPEEEAIVWIKKPISAKILFGPKLSADKQVEELKIVVGKIKKEGRGNYSIDLRIKNRAYWKKIPATISHTAEQSQKDTE
ncbi:MAG TPA: FtsQ-type POTRA domain-containing protein [Candidatus Portnoybacteria bacterium]|nr:FtsQ-type POTRA domain-containing protein [Candidatus Portnoybacteria bacterium]